MERLLYCEACLASNVKMYSLQSKSSSVSFRDIYYQFIQKPVLDTGQLFVCYECAVFLYKCLKFKLKCQKVQDVLSKIKLPITKTLLEDINRYENSLESALKLSAIIIHDNITPISDEKDLKVKSETDTKITNKDFDIKNEEQINYTTFDDEVEITELLNDTIEHADAINKTVKKKKRKPMTYTDDNNPSDEEPLSNKASKKKYELNKNIKLPRNFNVSYFEGYATVVFLSPEQAKQEVLLRKESSNYLNSPYKCDLCFRGYEAKIAFENHMKKHSLENGDFKCDICHLRFPEQRCLCKHRLACHKRKFHCKICPYVCFCTHQAKTHVSLHKGKKYPCKECGEIFSMPNSLLMHKRLKHSTQCVCALCGSTFATPRGLYSHSVKVHRQDKNTKEGPRCETCDVHFATEGAWKRHLVLSSKHSVSHGCKCCGEAFASEERLKEHMKAHARKHIHKPLKFPAPCLMCGAWLASAAEHGSHVAAAHPRSGAARALQPAPRPFVCEVCGHTFKKQCFLTYHQRKHSGERPFPCGECGAAFPLAAALASHRRTHAARALACHLCGRAFSFRSALNKHLKVHLGIRPHACPLCGKAFISPCDVRLHVRCAHAKLPWPRKRDRQTDVHA